VLTIHHLSTSQSDRVVWLAEELEVPYTLRWHQRGPDGLMPPDYLALHPAATAPVIEDDGLVLTESAVVLEHICLRHGKGRLVVDREHPEYREYLYWMHFNNNVQGLFFAHLAASMAGDPDNAGVRGFIDRRWNRYYGHLDRRLGEVPFVAGEAFSCADVMVTFNLTLIPAAAGRPLDSLKNVAAYVERITARPAYVKAMAIAGPAARRPDA